MFTPPQVILIVGGSQGIGLEVTKTILHTSSTAKTVVFGLGFDSDFDALSNAHPGRVIQINGDVTITDDRELALQTCTDEFLKVDTLVYCAGVITPIERIDKVDIDAVRDTFDVNVFGAIAMVQLMLPFLRKSSSSNPTNAAFGKVIILSSTCDTETTYHGWMPYCTSKAALTRFIQVLAHEERTLTVQGVYPKLTRTKMPERVIAGKYKGVMADHEVERFRIWDKVGDEMVEPPGRCGEAVAKLAIGLFEGGKSGETLYYDEHVPKKVAGT